jgi:hypothetical protein
VSNRKNLDLCIKYVLAGFTNSINGVWTFLDIKEGDFLSFLYGAKAYNLYVVESKEAIKNAENLPPWPPVTFKQSGNTYYFPFRLNLKPVRRFEESLVRAEFNYVAENLLLRGGYRRTHFQADQTTLQAVSQMGTICNDQVDRLILSNKEVFVPKFTKDRDKIFIPEIFQFKELILQALIREYLSVKDNLNMLLEQSQIFLEPDNMEILGEKAFPEGFVDILIKEATPIGISRKIIIEVKTGVAREQDVNQLEGYADEIGEECITAILIASKFSKKVVKNAGSEKVKFFKYNFDKLIEEDSCFTFEELLKGLKISRI